MKIYQADPHPRTDFKTLWAAFDDGSWAQILDANVPPEGLSALPRVADAPALVNPQVIFENGHFIHGIADLWPIPEFYQARWWPEHELETLWEESQSKIVGCYHLTDCTFHDARWCQKLKRHIHHEPKGRGFFLVGQAEEANFYFYRDEEIA